MSPEQLQRTFDFIVEHLAQCAVNLQQLSEHRVEDRKLFDRLDQILLNHDVMLQRNEELLRNHEQWLREHDLRFKRGDEFLQ